jgi:hypothetical protein
VRTGFKTLNLSKRLFNKMDPRKWSDFNVQWRNDYLDEVALRTDVNTVYFMDECHVVNGRYPYCWWYKGTRTRTRTRFRTHAHAHAAVHMAEATHPQARR